MGESVSSFFCSLQYLNPDFIPLHEFDYPDSPVPLPVFWPGCFVYYAAWA